MTIMAPTKKSINFFISKTIKISNFLYLFHIINADDDALEEAEVVASDDNRDTTDNSSTLVHTDTNSSTYAHTGTNSNTNKPAQKLQHRKMHNS